MVVGSGGGALLQNAPLGTPRRQTLSQQSSFEVRSLPMLGGRNRLTSQAWGAPTVLLFEPPAQTRDLEAGAARLAEKAPNVMLYLELPEGLQGGKIPFKRFKANIL